MGNEARLIDANEASRFLLKVSEDLSKDGFAREAGAMKAASELVTNEHRIRTIEVVKHARWISSDKVFMQWTCSRCGSTAKQSATQYCSDCGARMDESWRE